MTPSTALWRGIKLQCPQCGQAGLLHHYLKPIETCPQCATSFMGIQADDAPPWLTIFLTGHIMAPLMVYMVRESTWPQWAQLSFLLTVASLVMGMLLPRCKGLFIAALWLKRQ